MRFVAQTIVSGRLKYHNPTSAPPSKRAWILAVNLVAGLALPALGQEPKEIPVLQTYGNTAETAYLTRRRDQLG